MLSDADPLPCSDLLIIYMRRTGGDRTEGDQFVGILSMTL
jgi:hypothetical protein